MEPWSRPLLILSSVVLFALITTFFALPGHQVGQNVALKSHETFTAPRQNIFAELTEDESADVYDFVLTEFEHLNLTKTPKSGQDNFVNLIETLRPNKSDAVPYLYEDAPVTERWAKVTLGECIDDEAYLVYYMAGPLPVGPDTKVSPLEYTFNSGRNWVRNPIFDYVGLIELASSIGKNVSDITEELLGASINPDDLDDPDSLTAFPRSYRVEAGGLSLWLQFYRQGDGSGARSLLPQGVYAKIDASNADSTHWIAGEFYYNGVLYESEQAFRDAIGSPDFVKTPANLDGPWTDTEDFDSAPSGRDLPPPAMIQPYGPRYRLDRKEKFVSWFGFEFFISNSAAQGLSIHDVRFKGERVMYELGLQEAMAHYAGDDPMQGGLDWLDTFFGFGKMAFEMLQGYDCPAYADYLDSQWHGTGGTTTIPNNVCVFEYTADHLLSRHTAQYSVTATRNTYLIVRSVSTVGNYDYAIDYVFYLDGTLEVKVRASGFIFAAFYTANSNKKEGEYGHRIHDALASSMHDHVINFKADMDVAGSKNDMVRMAIEPMSTNYPWDLPEIKSRNTMHLVDYPVMEEAGLDWPKNGGEFYIVYSSDQKNAWGERKGYRITSGTGMGATPHLTIENSTVLGDSARWAEHDIWVLQQKDTEPRSADPLNFLEPREPIIDFTKMANHESLNHSSQGSEYDGDLVIYFNVGAHHVPHSGDVPNTLMHTSASSVMFVPHNFADRDPSRESSQGVRLDFEKETGGMARDTVNGDLRHRASKRSEKAKKTKVRHFGGTYEEGVRVPLGALEPGFEGYMSHEHAVSDLTFNGSAAGAWHREEP